MINNSNKTNRKIKNHEFCNLQNDTAHYFELPFLNLYLLKVFFIQLAFVLLLGSLIFCYLYYKQAKEIKLQDNAIKQVLYSNFKQYGELINLIENKLVNYQITSLPLYLLNTAEYNKLLSLKEKYIEIDNIYLISGNDTKTVHTQYGKEEFAILPKKEFFNDLKLKSDVVYQVKDTWLFIGKYLNNHNAFIILKFETDKFVKEISNALNFTATWSIMWPNNDSNLASAQHELSIKHEPYNLYEILNNNLIIIIITSLLFIGFSLIWVLKSRAFFGKLVGDFSLIHQENNNLTNHIKNLDLSFVHNRKAYCNFISSYNDIVIDILKNSNSGEEKATSVAQIINDCKSILYPELYNNQIECLIKITTEKNVDEEYSTILYILILNFLFKASYKTPKGGKIFVCFYQRQNHKLITVQDSGFDLDTKKAEWFYNIFHLPDHTLELLSKERGIKIVRSLASEVNTVELILLDKVYTTPTSITKENNVIKFPTNL